MLDDEPSTAERDAVWGVAGTADCVAVRPRVGRRGGGGGEGDAGAEGRISSYMESCDDGASDGASMAIGCEASCSNASWICDSCI